jgi:hypothetical protein
VAQKPAITVLDLVGRAQDIRLAQEMVMAEQVLYAA